MTRIVFAGGGSIGHVAPCIAVWRAIQELEPTAEAHVVCSPRAEEAEFLKAESMAFTALPVRNPTPLHPLQFFRCFRVARRVLREFRPDVIFSKGGGVSVPVAAAALLARVPVVLHESDAVSGRANMLVGLWAKKICKGFPSRQGSVQSSRTPFTGNPVRSSVLRGSREEGFRLTGLKEGKPVLLVVGGSQGSLALNAVVKRAFAELLDLVQVVHLTGTGKELHLVAEGYWAAPFAQENLPHLYAIADVALSRAGAGSLAELSAWGIPAIVVPLRGVAHDHQSINAKCAADHGGVILLEQTELERDFVPALRTLLRDPALLREMRERMRTFGHPDAAKTLAELTLRVGHRKT